MVEEDYVSFETAKELKKKGFPQSWLLEGVYFTDDKQYHKAGEFRIFESEDVYEADYSNWVTAPTLYVVQKWLREEKNIPINIEYCSPHGKYTIIYNGGIVIHSMLHYATYEEALKAAIKKALELI